MSVVFDDYGVEYLQDGACPDWSLWQVVVVDRIALFKSYYMRMASCKDRFQ